jgi:hypothetical protein
MIGTSQGETEIPLDSAEWGPRASGGDKGSFRTWSFNLTAYEDGLEKTLTDFQRFIGLRVTPQAK